MKGTDASVLFGAESIATSVPCYTSFVPSRSELILREQKDGIGGGAALPFSEAGTVQIGGVKSESSEGTGSVVFNECYTDTQRGYGGAMCISVCSTSHPTLTCGSENFTRYGEKTT